MALLETAVVTGSLLCLFLAGWLFLDRSLYLDQPDKDRVVQVCIPSAGLIYVHCRPHADNHVEHCVRDAIRQEHAILCHSFGGLPGDPIRSWSPMWCSQFL